LTAEFAFLNSSFIMMGVSTVTANTNDHTDDTQTVQDHENEKELQWNLQIQQQLQLQMKKKSRKEILATHRILQKEWSRIRLIKSFKLL